MAKGVLQGGGNLKPRRSKHIQMLTRCVYNNSSDCEKERKGSESNCSRQESDKDFSEEDLSDEIEFHSEDTSIEKNKKLHKHVLIIS